MLLEADPSQTERTPLVRRRLRTLAQPRSCSTPPGADVGVQPRDDEDQGWDGQNAQNHGTNDTPLHEGYDDREHQQAERRHPPPRTVVLARKTTLDRPPTASGVIAERSHSPMAAVRPHTSLMETPLARPVE
jgi:hypothetical protein